MKITKLSLNQLEQREDHFADTFINYLSGPPYFWAIENNELKELIALFKTLDPEVFLIQKEEKDLGYLYMLPLPIWAEMEESESLMQMVATSEKPNLRKSMYIEEGLVEGVEFIEVLPSVLSYMKEYLADRDIELVSMVAKCGVPESKRYASLNIERFPRPFQLAWPTLRDGKKEIVTHECDLFNYSL